MVWYYLNIQFQGQRVNLHPIIFILTPFGRLRSIPQATAYFITSYGNTVFDLNFF